MSVQVKPKIKEECKGPIDSEPQPVNSTSTPRLAQGRTGVRKVVCKVVLCLYIITFHIEKDVVQVGEVGIEVRVEEDLGGNLEDLEIEDYNLRFATEEMPPCSCLALDP